MKLIKHNHFNFRNKNNILDALHFQGIEQERLFDYARLIRDDIFQKKVEVRSVVEYSNICQQACSYCGMNKTSSVKRYILSGGVFLNIIEMLYNKGRRVVLIQAGEFNSTVYFNTLHKLLKQVKNLYPDLTLMCSFGNLSEYKYKKLREIGIERYLLKFETSDKKLYKRIKSSDTLPNRLNHIEKLKKLGFQVSSGNITGLPGQTIASLADDLILLKNLDFPMGSTSVFIPNNMSCYANHLPGNLHLALNFMAILRIMCPAILIPSTSSLELIGSGAQYLGLMAGANVVTLHDGTPKVYENKYIIYNQDRYKPKDILFKVARKAGLDVSSVSLIQNRAPLSGNTRPGNKSEPLLIERTYL